MIGREFGTLVEPAQAEFTTLTDRAWFAHVVGIQALRINADFALDHTIQKADYADSLRSTLPTKLQRLFSNSVELLPDPGDVKIVGQYSGRRGKRQIKTAEKLATEKEADLQYALGLAREALTTLSPKQQRKIDVYLDSSAPRIMRYWRNRENFTESGVELAPTRTWFEWLTNCDDKQLMHFLEWHRNLVDAQQHSKRAENEIACQRKTYKQGIHEGLEVGWLHPEATQAFEQVDEVQVFIGDIFDTTLQERGGYHTRGTSWVVVEQGMGPFPFQQWTNSLTGKIEWALKHELNHAVLGWLPWRWLDEAVTEHIARTMDHWFPDEIDPVKRVELARSMGMGYELGGYEPERKLLALICTEGKELIPASLLTRAYSARSKKARKEAMVLLEEAAEAAWGNSKIFEEISQVMETRELAYIDQGYSSREAESRASRMMIEHVEYAGKMLRTGQQDQVTFSGLLAA